MHLIRDDDEKLMKIRPRVHVWKKLSQPSSNPRKKTFCSAWPWYVCDSI